MTVSRRSSIISFFAKLFCNGPKVCSDSMLFEPIPKDRVFVIEKILSDIPQEMKVTDKIWHLGKHLADRIQNSSTHVMHHGQRQAVVSFELLEKRHDHRRVFR